MSDSSWMDGAGKRRGTYSRVECRTGRGCEGKGAVTHTQQLSHVRLVNDTDLGPGAGARAETTRKRENHRFKQLQN